VDVAGGRLGGRVDLSVLPSMPLWLGTHRKLTPWIIPGELKEK